MFNYTIKKATIHKALNRAFFHIQMISARIAVIFTDISISWIPWRYCNLNENKFNNTNLLARVLYELCFAKIAATRLNSKVFCFHPIHS